MRWAMRIFGALNIIASLLSLYYLYWMIRMHLGRWPGNPTLRDWMVFDAIATVSTLMVVAVAYLGVRLIRGNPHAIWQIGIAFFAEIAYEWADIYFTWVVTPFSKQIIAVGFWGIAGSACETQVLSGYAVFGLAAALVLLSFKCGGSLRARSSVAETLLFRCPPRTAVN